MLWDHTSTAKACFKIIINKRSITGTTSRSQVIVNPDKMVMIYQPRINQILRRINSLFLGAEIGTCDKFHSKEIITIKIKYQVIPQEASSPWTAPISTPSLQSTTERGINTQPKFYNLPSNSTWHNLFWMHHLILIILSITITILFQLPVHTKQISTTERRIVALPRRYLQAKPNS